MLQRIQMVAAVCLAVTLLIGCNTAGPQMSGVWEPCAAPGVEPFVRLSATGGIAGMHETIAVRCDGTVEHNGEVSTRDATLVSSLVTQLRDSGVLELPDGIYDLDRKCADCFKYELELADGTTTHRWSSVYELQIPEQLRAAIETVRAVDATR